MFTQTDLDNALAALNTNALRVRIGEREIIYRSQSELLQLIGTIKKYLDGVSSSASSTSLIKSTYKKGQS
jgi:hypothetical protein